jgi:hypothetical protein
MNIRNFFKNIFKKKKKVYRKPKNYKRKEKIKNKSDDNFLIRILKNNLPKKMVELINQKYKQLEKDIIKFRLDLETHGIGYFFLIDKDDLYIILFINKDVYVGKRKNDIPVPKYGGYVFLNKNEIRVYPLLNAIIASKTKDISKMKKYISFEIIYKKKLLNK